MIMRGTDKFRERFAGHEGEYVLIGGGACDLQVRPSTKRA